jgi:hypothetical protein
MLPGELDITSSGSAFGYVRDVIDRHQMPVILNMAGLSFCDARGPVQDQANRSCTGPGGQTYRGLGDFPHAPCIGEGGCTD